MDQSGALGDCPIWPNTEPGKGREGIHAPRKKAYERLVLLIAASWLAVVGATLAYMLYDDKTGWALLFGGILAVPLFTVTYSLAIMRRYRNRVVAPK